MKIFPYILIFSIACQSGTNTGLEETETRIQPKAYRQTTHKVDTIAGHVVKELVNMADVVLNESGEIEALNQADFSFTNQSGAASSGQTVYRPELSWFFSHQSKLDVNWTTYSEKGYRDTLIIDGHYGFLFNEKAQMQSFMDYIGGNLLYYKIDLIYDHNGQWTQIMKGSLDERSGHWSYEITERELMYESSSFGSSSNTYLSINEDNVFNKEKRSIVDYYVLAQKSGIFQPENLGGTFDIPNGFSQYEDEGTGAGLYTNEVALFRTPTKDILAINSYSLEPMSVYSALTGSLPKFYSFNGNGFDEIEGMFPGMSEFGSDLGKAEEGQDIVNYFKLPQKGLAIKYFNQDKIINIPFNKFTGTFEIK